MPEITLQEALNCPDPVGFDFETCGLNWMQDKPLALGLGCDTFHGFIDLRKYDRELLISFFRDFFKNHRPILQNAKFDFHVLHQYYLPMDFICSLTFADTMLLSQIIDENKSHGLDSMTELWLGEQYLTAKRAVDVYYKEHKLKSYI